MRLKAVTDVENSHGEGYCGYTYLYRFIQWSKKDCETDPQQTLSDLSSSYILQKTVAETH